MLSRSRRFAGFGPARRSARNGWYGPIAAAGGVDGPSQIIGASDRFWWYRGDHYTLNGTDVSAWDDIWGLAPNLEQATPANQPAYSATGGPNSTPIIVGDGTQFLEQNGTTVVPADTDWWVYAVVLANAAGNAFLGYAEPASFWHRSASTDWRYDEPGFVAAATSSGVGTWDVLRFRRVDDSLGAVRVRNGTEETVAIGAASTAMTQVIALQAFGVECAMAEYICCAPLSEANDTAMMAYFTDRYGIP